nr:ornithine cyclodeaminase family protein [Hyphomonas sp. Mor2]
MTKLKILSRASVESILTMRLCVDAMDEAMRAMSSNEVLTPLRLFAPIGEERGVFALMPAAVAQPPFFGVKTVSLLHGNAAQGLPTIQGYVALFSQETGAPLAIMDGVSLTAIRTAAASGVATRELARDDSVTHGIIGTGVQAETHAKAILEVRPNIKNTVIWGRTEAKAEALAMQLSNELSANVSAASLEQAASCDIVSVVTSSSAPVINADLVRPGAHVNLVGAHTPDTREADTELIASARVYVDLLSAALAEAGDIMIPLKECAFEESHIVGEIGQVLLNQIERRQTSDEITIFKSLGNAAQDLFAAAAVYENAVGSRQGTDVEF